jgi:hypothetical protein
MIYKMITVEMTPTPQELAAEFCDMSQTQQAAFFNEIADIERDRPDLATRFAAIRARREGVVYRPEKLSTKMVGEMED